MNEDDMGGIMRTGVVQRHDANWKKGGTQNHEIAPRQEEKSKDGSLTTPRSDDCREFLIDVTPK